LQSAVALKLIETPQSAAIWPIYPMCSCKSLSHYAKPWFRANIMIVCSVPAIIAGTLLFVVSGR
jgi:hypothetical protein